MLARVEKEPPMPRGTELLEGMGLVLPNLNHFDDEQDLRCATVTDVLSTYWDVLGAKSTSTTPDCATRSFIRSAKCTTDAARPISAPPAASILSQRISRRPISMTTTHDWFAA